MSIKTSIVAALKQNFVPGIILQCFALALVLIYFFVPASQPTFAWFSVLKHDYGYLYAIVATSLFGGLIPFMFLWLSKRFNIQDNKIALVLFYVSFWGAKGADVNFFYSMQGVWFGYENDFKTIATKVLIDQLVYSPIWAAASVAIPYLWVEYNFDWRRFCSAMDKTFFCEKIPTIIISSWMVWTPAVAVIYSMPQDLQIPLFNVVLCFWVLMLAVLNKK